MFLGKDERRASAALIAELAKHPEPGRVMACAVADRWKQAWVDRYGLKESGGAVSFARLVGRRRHANSLPRRRSDRPPLYPPCCDHPTLWLRDGKPAVFVSQPYHLNNDELHKLMGLCTAWGVTLRISTWSWYFPGSTFLVEMWAPGVDPSIRKEDRP